MELWLFNITDFGVPNYRGETPENPKKSIAYGRFLAGDFMMLGPDGLDLEPERIPCELYAGEKALMKVECEGMGMKSLQMLRQNLDCLRVRPHIPEEYRKYLDEPGLFLRLAVDR